MWGAHVRPACFLLYADASATLNGANIYAIYLKDVQRLALRIVSRRTNVHFKNEMNAASLAKDEWSAGTIDNQNFMQDNEWKLLHHHKDNDNGGLCACLPCCRTDLESKEGTPFHIKMIAVQTTKQGEGQIPKPKMKPV